MLKIIEDQQKPPYEDFYQAHYQRVLCYVKSKITSQQSAEDLVSEIFLYCFRHYDDYDPEKSSITTWLYLITNSRIKNYYRSNMTFTEFDAISDVLYDYHIDLDKGVYLEQLHKALIKAIRALPERQQKIIILRYFHNYSHEQIARQLGTTSGNVRVLLSRALDKLSSHSEEYWKEFKYNG